MTDAAALYTAKTPPGLFAAKAPSPYASPLESTNGGPTEGNGAISGGLLRPGSIDQTTFLQMLQQQQQNRAAAGVGGKAVRMPVQSFQTTASTKIPTLTSAQFAALVGGANATPDLAGAPQDGLAADPRAMAAAQAQLQAQAQVQAQLQAGKAAAPQGPALKLSGTANRNAMPNPQSALISAQGDADMPTITRKPQASQTSALDATAMGDEMPTITRKSAPVLEASASTGAEEKPADAESEDAAKSDPNVVHLKSPPDKEQIKELRMRNKRWVVDETPGARQLFFGADGEFGWDDFLDMINPLQHIPGIAQIYRAVTGDEINGAATLLGALPLGPLSGLGLVASVADLAVKDATGEDMGGNLMAMVFGKDEQPEGGATVPADMAQAGETGNATVEAATRQTAFAMSDTSALHSDCRG
jgi:hypothetical protein